MLYTNFIRSQHMDVLSAVGGSVGLWLFAMDRLVYRFSQGTGAGCRLVAKDWLEAHFAE